MYASKKDIVGIDIGTTAVKMVRLREGRGTYHLQNIGIMLLEPERIIDNVIKDSPAIVNVIQNMLESMKIKTMHVATSVSGLSVIYKTKKLPA